MQPSEADPRKYWVTLLAKDNNDYPVMNIGHINTEVGYDVTVDGFRFNGENVTTAGQTFAGALEIHHRYNAGHEKNMIRNCVFVKNKGRFAGAVMIEEAAKVFFDNCLFVDNESDAGLAEAHAAGAVLIVQAEDGPSEVEFYSCAFSNNRVQSGLYTGAIVTRGEVLSQAYPLKVVNCTFNDNSTAGTAETNIGSICNTARFYYGGGYFIAPAIVCNSILYSNPAEPNKEVYGFRSGSTVTDGDGNVYQTIVIGNQEWTLSNLKATKYTNGEPIQKFCGT